MQYVQYILRIGPTLYRLVQDTKTKLWSWTPIFGGDQIGGTFNTVDRALNFASDRVRVLGAKNAAVMKGSKEA